MMIEHYNSAQSQNNHTNNFQKNNRPKLLWINIGDREFSLADDYGNEIVISPFNGSKFFMAMFHSAKKGSFTVIPGPMSFGDCKMICEKLAQCHMSLKYAYANSPGRETAKDMPPTNKQIEILNQNYRYKESMSKFDAFIEIKKIFALDRKLKRLQNY